MPKIKVKGQTVQTGERPQTNGHAHMHTHRRYQTYYLPSYAVDNELLESRLPQNFSRIGAAAGRQLTSDCAETFDIAAAAAGVFRQRPQRPPPVDQLPHYTETERERER